MTLPTTLTDDERHTLAGEYVLGTLDAATRRALHERMETDTQLASAVDRWNQRMLPLAALAAPINPPPRLWIRLEASLGLGPSAPWWHKSWLSLPLWRALATTGLVASVWMATVLVKLPQGDAPKFLVVLVAPQDKAPGWVVQASNAHQVSLIPLGTLEVPKDRALQFWTKAEGWQAPVSLGLVKPGQRVQVPLDALPALTPNQLFELTLEPATGSPTGKPTGPVQFIGRAVPIT